MAETAGEAAGAATDKATYEELAQIELEFEAIDNEMIAKQYNLSKPTYAKRALTIAKIPFFWASVFECAPPDIDQFIQPSDSAILTACLKNLTVERFEVPASIPPTASSASGGDASAAFGEPRSLLFRFEFAPNEYFEDTVLEKRFWYRRAQDGWSGRTSEPVRIRWKRGKDVTEGLTDAAAALWDAQQALGVPDGAEYSKELARRSAGLPEFAALSKLVDESVEGSLSFFAWFASRGRWVGAEESREASRIDALRNEKLRRGESVDDEDEDDDEDDEMEDELDMAEISTEVFPAGEDLALTLAEDLWPGAIGYFTESQEEDDLSDSDFEEAAAEAAIAMADADADGDEMDADDDEDDDDDEEEEKVPDIKSIVRGAPAAKNGAAPPKKKRRT